MKRATIMIAALLAAALLLSACGPTMAAGSESASQQEINQHSSTSSDIAFSDVSPNAWYADAIAYCLDNGIMSGTSATEFSPNADMSRAMMATVIWRLEGSPTTTIPHTFADVESGAWYTNAILWTVETEIMSGYSETTFGTNDPVTREQIATILYRYEAYKNGTPILSVTLSFADTDTISDWAKEAVSWSVEKEIVSGKPGNIFDPQSNASRAEVAVMLYRYLMTESETSGETEPPAETIPNPTPETSGPSENGVVTDEDGMIAVNITINGEAFAARFYDNASARVLLEQMPFSIDMNDYAGQEKVIGLPYDLPNATTERPATISAGELYLWSGNQLVFFYTTFSNSYGGYVRIGYVEDTTGLTSALGNGGITVTFSVAQ